MVQQNPLRTRGCPPRKKDILCPWWTCCRWQQIYWINIILLSLIIIIINHHCHKSDLDEEYDPHHPHENLHDDDHTQWQMKKQVLTYHLDFSENLGGGGPCPSCPLTSGVSVVNFEYPILILHNRGHASVVSFTYLMGKETQRPYRKLKHKVRLFGGGNDRVNLVFNALLGTSKWPRLVVHKRQHNRVKTFLKSHCYYFYSTLRFLIKQSYY